jgi:hypothetical protein
MIYLNKSLSGKISIRGTAMTGYLRVTAADTIMADTIPLDPTGGTITIIGGQE